MINVLFVCLGNICRSTMAEGIFSQMIADSGLNKFINCDSAGISAYHLGEDPDHRTLEILLKHGTKLTHKGRQLNANDLDYFDYILAMDVNNYNDITLLAKSHQKDHSHVIMMRNFDSVKDSQNVPDPYWSMLDGFEEVYQILYRSNTEFLKFLRKKRNI
ncbi:MAG TPA: low molecular weight protein-tyrosine-phosphatase [Cytophagaceae bacterium]|jgi:protein-tyrosine phosphatase|nr:low molecular weight protein-tyrosine-phosphatase [Cytophagaceae bacterium]